MKYFPIIFLVMVGCVKVEPVPQSTPLPYRDPFNIEDLTEEDLNDPGLIIPPSEGADRVPFVLLFDLHNIEREMYGSPKLKSDPALNKYAQDWAEKMASTGRLTHSSLSYSGYRVKGENIAAGQQTEMEVHGSWMRSSGHKNNILKRDYTHVGFGRSGNYWCACFGGR